MRCKQCDYRLWNLKSRNCPECGAMFKPSDFEFKIDSVQFCCPHCEQVYYGSGLKGHLEPSRFTCVHCGVDIDMDQMILRPLVDEDQTLVERNPWLERGKRGWLKAWLATVGQSMVRPGHLIRNTPLDSPLRSALNFAGLNLMLSVFVGGLIMIVPFAIGIMFSGIGYMVFFMIAVWLGTMIAFGLGWLLLWTLAAHGWLSLSGSGRGGMRRTVQALCYSSGVNALCAIPCLGLTFSGVTGIWWTVSAILMLKEGHQIRGSKATAAVLPLPIFAALAMVALIGFNIYWVHTHMIQYSTQVQMQSATNIKMSLELHGKINRGQGPKHAIELFQLPGLSNPYDLIAPGSTTRLKDMSLGGFTMEDYDAASPSQRQTMRNAVVSAMPADAVAHRLGDYVFTYHGIDFNQPPPDLWLIIRWPDPLVSTNKASPSQVEVITSNGSHSFPLSLLHKSLTDQNAVRARHHLPPLPDPATVTHDRLAVTSGIIPMPVIPAQPNIPPPPHKPSSVWTLNSKFAFEFQTIMLNFGSQSDGVGPAHAIEFFGDQSDLQPRVLIAPGSATTLADIHLGGITMQEYLAAPAAQQQSMRKDVLNAMPANVVAHRLGDCVFTYHGIDLSHPPPGLWLVVHWPDPQMVGNSSTPNRVQVITTQSIHDQPNHLFPKFLAEQNTLRAQYQLPPLPEPVKVTHDQPVIASEPISELAAAPADLNLPNTPTPSKQSPMVALLAYGQLHRGQGPGHALALFDIPGMLRPEDLIAPGSATTLADIRLGGFTLQDYLAASTEQQEEMKRAVLSAMPPNVTAHRLGDYVFTYHGINLQQDSPDLYLVIRCPDPQVPGNHSPSKQIQAFFTNGTHYYPLDHIAHSFAPQNALRAQHYLPPLPSPNLVTHDQPALASAIVSIPPPPPRAGPSPPNTPPIPANLTMKAFRAFPNAVMNYGRQHGGQGPVHAIEMFGEQSEFQPQILIAPNSATTLADMRLGGFTMQNYATASAAQQEAMRRTVITTMPANVVAHRLGDRVFTYHGIKLSKPPPDLWLYIQYPDPEVAGNELVTSRVYTEHTNGGRLFPINQLPQHLADQNILRARHHLPPLPDPATVTHDQPAVDVWNSPP